MTRVDSTPNTIHTSDMHATLTNQAQAPATERRAADGTFKNCPGPGRPSKRILGLRSRYKTETVSEELQRLADDIPRLECELQAIDDEVADRERKFLESISAAVRHREEVALTLSRARVVKVYVCDPVAFGVSGETPSDVAAREYQEIRRELEEAQSLLADTPEPSFTRQEALGDADRWAKLHAYETVRDRVDELLGQENRARQTAVKFGHGIPPLGTGPTQEGGDPFARHRVPGRVSERLDV